MRNRSIFVAVGDDNFLIGFEATVCGKIVESNDAFSVPVVLFGNILDSVAVFDGIFESGDWENEDLVARTNLVYVIEIIRPENRIDGDMVVLCDFPDRIAFLDGVYFDALSFFRVFLNDGREIGRGNNSVAGSIHFGRIFQFSFRINRARCHSERRGSDIFATRRSVYGELLCRVFFGMKIAGEHPSGLFMGSDVGSGYKKSTRHDDGECGVLTKKMQNPNGLVLFEINNTLSLEAVNASIPLAHKNLCALENTK